MSTKNCLFFVKKLSLCRYYHFENFFFVVFGIENWIILAFIWALVPLANTFYFSQVPLSTLTEKNEGTKKLLSSKILWLFVLLMICSGASEQAMSQWASAFAESGLQVSKTVGDLAGPCMFAALMGASRAIYSRCSEKINLRIFMICSCFLSVAGYLLASMSPHPALALAGCGLCGLAAGILWPGTYSLSAAHFPGGGTAMFAILALAGDLGCSLGPTVVGFVSDSARIGGDLKTGLLAATFFPVALIAGLVFYKRHKTII